MSDETEVEVLRGKRKLFLKRSASGTLRIASGLGGVKPEDNLVLRQLQSLRNENQVILERHVRDRELIVRLAERVEQGFDNVRSDVRDLRAEVKEMRSDLVMLENKILTNQNEILSILRRLDDDEEMSAFEIIEEAELGSEPPAPHG